MDRWFGIEWVYFIGTALLFEIVCFALPLLSGYYQLGAKILFCLAAGHCVFVLTQDRLFKKRINPENKAVFITGCDSGFGYQLAKQLDSVGYHVFAGCLFPTSGGAAELKSACSSRFCTIHVDVSRDESVQKAKEFIEKNLGKCELWAVVNNAGVYKGLSVELSKMSDFEDTLEVNALGQVRVTKMMLPLIRRYRGRIVNVNSMAGRISTPHLTAYTMSKYTSVAFTECLRREMAIWDVKVISIEPEFFTTPMTNSENTRKYLDTICSGVEDSVRQDYGERHIRRIKVWLKFLFSIASSNTHHVIDAMEAAVSLEHPCPIYKPCGNKFREVVFRCGENLPTHTMDAIFWILHLLIKVPKPEATNLSQRAEGTENFNGHPTT